MNEEIMYKLGGIEALVNSINEKLDKFIADTKEVHKDHEERISSLEKLGVKITLIASGVSSGFGIAVGVLLKLWQN